MKEKSRDSAASADAVTLRVATSETIVVPAGMVVEFELIGGGGAGGHWGGERGSPGSRVVGVLPAAAADAGVLELPPRAYAEFVALSTQTQEKYERLFCQMAEQGRGRRR